MSHVRVESCFKLAINGSPSKGNNRGMSLDLRNSYVDQIFETLTNIDLTIVIPAGLTYTSVSPRHLCRGYKRVNTT